MNIKVNEIMTGSVITIGLNRTIDHAHTLLKQNHIGAVPIVDDDNKPVGVISAADLLQDLNGMDPVAALMSDKVYTIPQYEEVSVAARMMRNHKIHHLIVTHEQQVVGIVSAFDLLKLVEDHRFVIKNAPTPSKRKGVKRA